MGGLFYYSYGKFNDKIYLVLNTYIVKIKCFNERHLMNPKTIT